MTMRAAVFTALVLLSLAASARAATLQLQAKIPLPASKGRIDHLAFDPVRGRLYVAELGNGSVAIIDVNQRRLERRLEGLDEPQGVAYFAPTNRLYVAAGGDGSVRAYDADKLVQIKSIKLAGDADNIRIDAVAKRVYVGYGDGALAVLDVDSLERKGDIPLHAHPESFQLSPVDARIYVNVTAAREIAVVDRTTGRQIGSWPATRWSAHYPMAIDAANKAVLSVFRGPARIARYSMVDGSILQERDTCEDADDVFVDAKRKRVYIVCGQGVVDILDLATLERRERFVTSPGARTGLYSETADLLFVAARADGKRDAAIWMLSPVD
jgi:DNA-binding beta-propeller fold protein YncE